MQVPPPPVLGGHRAEGASLLQRGEHARRGTDVQRGWIELVAYRDLDRPHHGFVADAGPHRAVELVLIQLARLELEPGVRSPDPPAIEKEEALPCLPHTRNRKLELGTADEPGEPADRSVPLRDGVGHSVPSLYGHLWQFRTNQLAPPASHIASTTGSEVDVVEPKEGDEGRLLPDSAEAPAESEDPSATQPEGKSHPG